MPAGMSGGVLLWPGPDMGRAVRNVIENKRFHLADKKAVVLLNNNHLLSS